MSANLEKETLTLAATRLTLTRTGAEFDAGMSFQEWAAQGRQLMLMSGASNFWIGDWLNFGNAAYGEKYRDAVGLFGASYETLRNVASICARVDARRRNPALSWTHHEIVAALNAGEQTRWLEKAEREKWSAADLRQALRRRKAILAEETEASPGLFKWARHASELARELKSQLAASPVSAWDDSRKRAVREELAPLKELIEALFSGET